MLIVPPTLMLASVAGSATEWRTSIWAARWKIASGLTRPTRSLIAAPSRMSASTSSTPRSSAPARFSRRPVEMSSTTVTSSPRSSRASTRFEPMKPAPPVTRVRIEARHSSHAGRAPPEPVVPSLAVGGLLVTFEGIDRSGKTTQARLLADALGERALAVRERGGTPMGGGLRDLLKDPAVEMSARTEALLFAAARAQLVERVVRPALESGLVVVSDRFVDSSRAYQGEARGLGVEEVARVNEWAVAGLRPDLTFLLALSA